MLKRDRSPLTVDDLKSIREILSPAPLDAIEEFQRELEKPGTFGSGVVFYPKLDIRVLYSNNIITGVQSWDPTLDPRSEEDKEKVRETCRRLEELLDC